MKMILVSRLFQRIHINGETHRSAVKKEPIATRGIPATRRWSDILAQRVVEKENCSIKGLLMEC